MEYRTSPGPARYHPVEDSRLNVIPGAAAVPLTFFNGASIGPLPDRDRLSCIAIFMSFIVEFAHVDVIVVPVTTGLPMGSV